MQNLRIKWIFHELTPEGWVGGWVSGWVSESGNQWVNESVSKGVIIVIVLFIAPYSLQREDVYHRPHTIVKKIYRLLRNVSCSFKLKFNFQNVFSFKRDLISILIWSGFVEYQNWKNLRSLLAIDHDKLLLVINWVKFSYMLTSKRDNLAFTWTFVTWCFPRKGIQHDPLCFLENLGRCAHAFSSLLEIV